MKLLSFIIIGMLLSFAFPVVVTIAAQEHDCANCPKTVKTSTNKNQKYAGKEKRVIKALDEDQMNGYLSGEGMGMALPAELNHYPGPRHLLGFADGLNLSVEQKNRIQKSYDMMHVEAVRLGRQIVEKERGLDSLFANQLITDEELANAVNEISALQGKLRLVHLQAHLTTRVGLTAEQIAKYDELRGYGKKGSHKMNHMKM